MKNAVALALLAAMLHCSAAAEVFVRETSDPVTNTRTVVLAVKGDRPFGEGPGAPLLCVKCEQLGKHQRVSLLLSLDIVAKSPMLLTPMRFEGSDKRILFKWERTQEPSTLISHDETFVREKLLTGRRLHIMMGEVMRNDSFSSFDLSGLAKAFARQAVCKK